MPPPTHPLLCFMNFYLKSNKKLTHHEENPLKIMNFLTKLEWKNCGVERGMVVVSGRGTGIRKETNYYFVEFFLFIYIIWSVCFGLCHTHTLHRSMFIYWIERQQKCALLSNAKRKKFWIVIVCAYDDDVNTVKPKTQQKQIQTNNY